MSTAPERRTPTYAPVQLESDAVLLGLRWPEIVLVAVGCAGALVLMLALHSLVGLAAGVPLVLAVALLAGVRVEGWRAWEWLVLRRRFGASRRRRRVAGAPLELAGMAIVAADVDGRGRVGLLRDRRAGTWSAVLECGSTPVALADEHERADALGRWGSALDQICRLRDVYRVAWVASSSPDPGDAVARWFLTAASPQPSGPRAAYAHLLTEAAPRAEAHQVHLVVVVHEGRSTRAIQRAGGGEAGAVAVVMREVDAVRRILAHAEIPVRALLEPHELAAELRMELMPDVVARMRARDGGVDPAEAWPQALDERWDVAGTDQSLHASWWVAGIPKRPVAPDFLAPLILQGGCFLRVAWVGQPIAPERAARDAEHEIVALETDLEEKAKRGFRTSALERRTVETVRRREEELASGFSDWRYSMVVTVSADTPERLEAAKELAERAASSAQLRLQPLVGQEAKALVASSLLATGLTPERRSGPERGVLLRSVRVPAHRASSAQVCALYPFAAPPVPEPAGAYVGQDPFGGGSFCFDPFAAYERGLAPNANVFISGELRKGKSSLVKTLLYRLAAFGHRIVVVDVKGEYRSLAKALGVVPLSLSPNGGVRLNPLDVAAGTAPADVQRQREELLGALLEASLERRLAPEERTALSLGIARAAATQSAAAASPTLSEVVDALFAPDEGACRAVSSSADAMVEWGRSCAHELRRLCRGDLAGLFDGQTTAGVDPRGHVIVDVSALHESPALPLAVLLCAAWLRKDLFESRARSIFVFDEAWAVLGHTAITRWVTSLFKLASMWGVSMVLVAHRLADLAAVGGQGSEASQRAVALVADTGTRVLYGQPVEQAALVAETFGLGSWQRHLLSRLPRGTALWHMGERAFLVSHVLGSHEQALVTTDERLVGAGVAEVVDLTSRRPAHEETAVTGPDEKSATTR